MKPTCRRRRERGIALLLVLIAVVLLGALATEVSQTAATQSTVGRNTMSDLLLRTAVEGRAQILRAALAFDASSGQSIDTDDDVWSWRKNEEEHLSDWGIRTSEATGGSESEDAVAYDNTRVELLAWCEDERSKLNLLGLSRARDTQDFTFTRDALIRLIDEFREDTAYDLTEADAQEMVDDLLRWLEDQAEEDENPMPPVASGRGRLQSVDDLLRVPGGKWTSAVLHDVVDPDRDPDEDVDDGDVANQDADFERVNGIAGLGRYLTVHAEPVANAPLRINVNTAPRPVLRALFDVRDADLADAIIEHRHEGAGDTEDAGSSTAAGDDEVGYFQNKAQLSRVEGMADSLDAYPRLDYFADTRSDVFSLRVIATMVTGSLEGGADFDDAEEDDGPRDITATFQYREVVQRLDQGFVTLFVERRQDPLHDR